MADAPRFVIGGSPTATAQQSQAAPLRQQILDSWGQYGNWKSADQDQADDLARLLEANGVTDLSKLKVGKKTITNPAQKGVVLESRESGDLIGDIEEKTFDAPVLEYEGRQIGFLGDINKDGSLARVGERDTLSGPVQQPEAGKPGMLAWSAKGKGHTTFNIVAGPDGKPIVAPTWGSSSDAGDIRTAAITALAMFGTAYLAPMAGAAAGGAGTVAGAAAQGAVVGAGTNATLAAASGADSSGILKAAGKGALTGAAGGAITSYGNAAGWDKWTTGAVKGGANALLRGGSGEDILRGAATGGISGYIDQSGITGNKAIDGIISGAATGAINGGVAGAKTGIVRSGLSSIFR